MADETLKTEETQEGSGVTAGDLALMVQVIDAGSQRGAWRGEELATVGALRNKLAGIVKALNPPAEETKNETDAEVDTAAKTTEEVPAKTDKVDAV
ncbi:hypothetical protein LCGC14_1716730 [marine sediment metagenome]|uniref:Uncharacterized protein n=1 Tax=marine sediment metagenome TaxID=412755 RepID=A0A0F9HDD1_9ZZZZ